MGKYIIEVGDAYVRHALGRKLIIPVIINNDTEYWVNTNIQLTPYTEPDLEHVREEAYENGYKTAKVQRNIQAEKDLREVGERHYQKGLSDAWAAARKIVTMPNREFINSDILDLDHGESIFTKYTASEAIEKIRQYEQEGKQIQVGDVVRVKNAPEVEIWVTDISDEDGGLLSGLALKTVDDSCDMGDTYANRNIYNFERTGKHYDMPTVLEKMRGGQDG